jgi:hypothetical protein
MASAFTQATAVGVRRQAKDNDKSVSLKRFLLEVKRYPELVSREHYLSLYAGTEASHVERGHRDFDRVAGQGHAHIPAALVEDQLRQLCQAVDAIEHYVDRRIAHYDQRGVARPTPTLADLTAALQILERIVILYWRLLKGPVMTTLMPAIQVDWQNIFRFSWIPSP